MVAATCKVLQYSNDKNKVGKICTFGLFLLFFSELRPVATQCTITQVNSKRVQCYQNNNMQYSSTLNSVSKVKRFGSKRVWRRFRYLVPIKIISFLCVQECLRSIRFSNLVRTVFLQPSELLLKLIHFAV